MIRLAFAYKQSRISVIPLRPRSKRPLVEWAAFAERFATDDELHGWFPPGTKNNIAGVMGTISELLAIDADDKDRARDLYSRLPRTAMMTKTPRGAHFFYRLRPGQVIAPAVHVTVCGIVADIRSQRSYVALGGSTHPNGLPYVKLGTWRREEVPFFDESWLGTSAGRQNPLKSRRGPISNLADYLARVESFQGQHGSAGLVRAAAICRDNGLSEAEAMVQLLRWNNLPVVRPPWSHPELARAVTRVYRGEA